MRPTRPILRDLKEAAPVISMMLVLALVVYIKWSRCGTPVTLSFNLSAPMASRE